MKAAIHPKYVESVIRCACGASFKTRSTRPEIHAEICSSCHPLFTGKQKIIDPEGRVERFQRKYAAGAKGGGGTPRGGTTKSPRRAKA